MTDKEKNLIAGCLKQEKAAWDTFVKQYTRLVYHSITSTLRYHHYETRDDFVDDLYQEFFVSIVRDDFKKLRQFRGDKGCSLASWIRFIAGRLTVDFLRSETVRKLEISDNMSADEPEVLDSVIEEEQARLISQTLETLPAKDRIFIDLYYRQNLGPEEIAKILGVSVGAVYTQNSRLRVKLREILTKNRSL